MNTFSKLPQKQAEIFWGEITPCDHIVQIYENDDIFLDLLEGYIVGGLRSGDSLVVIATNAHLYALEDRFKRHGIDIESALLNEHYIPLEAETVLAKFMVNGWPDVGLFNRVVSELLERTRKNGMRVRAFGEMVAILWAQGFTGATVRLEYLWTRLCKAEGFSLFCAYPRIGFTQDIAASIQDICKLHSKVILDSEPHFA